MAAIRYEHGSPRLRKGTQTGPRIAWRRGFELESCEQAEIRGRESRRSIRPLGPVRERREYEKGIAPADPARERQELVRSNAYGSRQGQEEQIADRCGQTLLIEQPLVTIPP